MPAKNERTKVDIKESSTLELRSFSITLTAPVGDFQLTDLLRQRGVITGLDVELKRAVKLATETYLKSAETLVSSLATGSPSTRKSRSNEDELHSESVNSKKL